MIGFVVFLVLLINGKPTPTQVPDLQTCSALATMAVQGDYMSASCVVIKESPPPYVSEEVKK